MSGNPAITDGRAVEKMKSAVLYTINRAVVDYEFGQHLNPYTETWSVLTAAAAAILGLDEDIYRVTMMEHWRDCPPSAGNNPDQRYHPDRRYSQHCKRNRHL